MGISMKPLSVLRRGSMLASLVGSALGLAAYATGGDTPPVFGNKEGRYMTPQQASSFARLALKGIHKEYPNKPSDVLNGEGELKAPRLVHPAFYGCFDWHSSVHGHWMLVRVLRLYPELPEAEDIRKALRLSLSASNLK